MWSANAMESGQRQSRGRSRLLRSIARICQSLSPPRHTLDCGRPEKHVTSQQSHRSALGGRSDMESVVKRGQSAVWCQPPNLWGRTDLPFVMIDGFRWATKFFLPIATMRRSDTDTRRYFHRFIAITFTCYRLVFVWVVIYRTVLGQAI